MSKAVITITETGATLQPDKDASEEVMKLALAAMLAIRKERDRDGFDPEKNIR